MNEEQASQFINVRDLDTGEIGSYPAAQAQDLTGKGFEPVTDIEVQQYMKEQEFGTPEQQLKTAAEGALSAATFGLSTGIEKAFGVDPEAIKARAEVNPFIHGAGELVGLVGSSLLLPGGGAAGVMEKAGAEAGAAVSKTAAATLEAKKALDLAKETGVGVEQATAALKAAKVAEPAIAKIGSEGANQAVQFALMQAGDEVSKSFLDPERTLGNAVAEVGLSGLIGGAVGGGIGAISPLWKATLGPKTEMWLEKFKNRVDGASVAVNVDLEHMMKDAAPEIKAMFSQDPEMKIFAKQLIDSGTPAGDAFRATLNEFQIKVADDLGNIFVAGEGKTAFQAGTEAKESILKAADELHTGVRAKYDEIADTVNMAISDDARLKFYDKLVKEGQEFGAVGSDAEALFKTYSERALAQDSIGQLDKLVTEIGSAQNVAYRAGDFEKSRALGQIKEGIRDFQENYISSEALKLAKATGDENIILAAELLKDQRLEARKAYAEFMEKVGDIASLGKLGKVKYFGQLQDALESIPAAKFADKLFDKKNIEGLNYIKQNYPDVFESIITQKKTDLLEAATRTGELQHTKLLNSVNALPKEVQNLMFKPEELQAINLSGQVLRESFKKINPSGTSRARDIATGHLGAGAAAVVGALTGHNPIVAGIMGELGQRLGVDAPAATKLALLKFLGSSGEISAPGLKAAVQYAHEAYNGNKLITKAAKQIFTVGPEVTIRAYEQQDRARVKLQKRIDEVNKNPEVLLDTGGETSVYLRDHAQEMAKTASNTINYLNSLKPKQDKSSPLDSKPVISPVDRARYNRALDIANKPMIVMEDIRNGTITANDVKDLQAMYPGAYQQMQLKIMDELVHTMETGKSIPYQTRLGLSVFMGQPLDSTMQPQAIMAAQNLIAPMQTQGQTIPGQRAKHSFTALNKMPGMMQTPQQARIQNRNK
jgi:hypothetical protein